MKKIFLFLFVIVSFKCFSQNIHFGTQTPKDSSDKSASTKYVDKAVALVGNNGGTSFLQEDFLGNIYSGRNFTTVSPLVNIGSVPVTASGGVLQFRGGTSNLYTQRLLIPWYTRLQRWMITDSFVVQNKTSTSFGPSIGVSSENGGNPISNIFEFDMTTGANSGKTSFWAVIPFPAYTSPALAFSVGDTISMTICRNVDTIWCITRNVTTGGSTFAKVGFDYGAQPYMHNISRPGIFYKGGDFDLLGISFSSNEVKNAPLMLHGDSKFLGSYATERATTMAGLLDRQYQNTVPHSGGGDGVAQDLLTIPEIAALKPSQVTISISRNSIGDGVMADTVTVFPLFNQLAHSIDSMGMKKIILTPMWESLALTKPVIKASRDFIIRTFPDSCVIDTWNPLKRCGNPCMAPDSVHPNDLGYSVMDSAIYFSNKVRYGDNKFFQPVANRGLSIRGKSVVLGQPLRAPFDPAAFTTDVEIPMAFWKLRLRQSGSGTDSTDFFNGNVTTTKDFISTGGSLRLPAAASSGSGAIYLNNVRFLTALGGGIYVGGQSGNFSVTGVANVALGPNALFSVSSGFFNVAVGHTTMQNVTSGISNVGVGEAVLFAGAGGIGHNTAMGQSSLTALITGLRNTAIGENSGSTCVTCNGNTFIGYDAGTLETTINNKLVISNEGNVIAGQTGHAAIYGDFSTNKYSVGNITPPYVPLATWEVKGTLNVDDSTILKTVRDGTTSDSVLVGKQLSAGNFVIHKVAQSSIGGGVTDSAIWKYNGRMTASHYLDGNSKSLGLGYASSLDSFLVQANRLSMNGAYFTGTSGLSDANQTLTAGTTQFYLNGTSLTANRNFTMGSEPGRVITLIIGNDNQFNWLPPASTVHDPAGNYITAFRNNSVYTLIGGASSDWIILNVTSLNQIVAPNGVVITSGSSSTMPNGITNVFIDPPSVLTTYNLTLATNPVDGAMIKVHFGGTITSGATVVTSLTISVSGGQTIIQNLTPTTATAGNCLIYQWRSSNSSYYREQ